MLDLKLNGATVIDGTKRPGYTADVGVQNGRVSAIGNLEDESAATVVECNGKVVAPGFVDVHTHSDGDMLTSGHLRPKVSQGISSEVLMLDGVSYAPVSDRNWREWFLYLRALNALPESAYRGWTSIEEYMIEVESRISQNCVSLVPYANVRALACGFGGNPVQRVQRRIIHQVIEAEMEAGSVGLSTGLDYIAQCHASTDELVDACRAIAPYDGLYVTHVRYELGLLAAMEEAIRIGRSAGVRVHISHLKTTPSASADRILEVVDRARRDLDLTFDVYPYQSSSTILSFLLPYDVWSDGPLAALDRLKSREVRANFRERLDKHHLSYNSIFFAWLKTEENRRLQGRSIAEVVAEQGVAVEDLLCDLLIHEELAVLLVMREEDDAAVFPFLQHEAYMFGSDGIYLQDGCIHPRMYGSATRLLGPLVRDYRLFTLEEAVFKLSQFPAERFGLVDRGKVAIGHYADLVVFDPAVVSDCADYVQPHCMSKGIDRLYVNGTLVWCGGARVEPDVSAYPGRWLRRGQSL